MRQFRADTWACAEIASLLIAFGVFGTGECSAATGRVSDEFLPGQVGPAGRCRFAYTLLHRV